MIETSRSETPDLQSGPLPLTELPLLKLYRLSSFTSRPIQTESQCFQLSEDIILNERYNLAAKSFIDVDKLEAVPVSYPYKSIIPCF